MSCHGTDLADFSSGITRLLPPCPWANTISYSHMKLRARSPRALPGELGRTLAHMAELPWHRGMFFSTRFIKQILFQEAILSSTSDKSAPPN